MRQLLVRLSEEDYRILEEYCRKTGKTKSAVIRGQIARLREESLHEDLRKRKIERISPGSGKLLSDLIREMRF